MRNLVSTRMKIIIVVAVLLAAALTVLSNVTGQTVPDLVVQGVLAPFRAAGNALTSTAEQYYSYMFQYEALAAENAELKPWQKSCGIYETSFVRIWLSPTEKMRLSATDLTEKARKHFFKAALM